MSHVGLLRRREMAGGAAPVPPLPYDAEVEYLESTSGSYFGTGIKSNGKISLKIHAVDYFNNASKGNWLFGGRDGNNNKMFGMFINSNTGAVQFAYNSSQNVYNVCTSYPSTTDVEVGNGQVKIGTTTHTYTKSNFASTARTVILFGLNNGGTILSNGGVKIQSVYATDGTTTIDWIAVRVGQVGCMYDRISGELVYGTGTFNIGNDKT